MNSSITASALQMFSYIFLRMACLRKVLGARLYSIPLYLSFCQKSFQTNEDDVDFKGVEIFVILAFMQKIHKIPPKRKRNPGVVCMKY